MKNWSIKQIRDTYLNYYQSKGDLLLPNSSLVPKDDETLLFENSGMSPLKEEFLGNKKPLQTNMCSIQTCLRTVDLDSVPDKHHYIVFHMLGSFSIGKIDKKITLSRSLDLMLNYYKMPKEKLFFSVFSGDEQRGMPFDQETYDIWIELGIDKSHIVPLPFEDNFWRMGGDNDGSPCGPCSECYFDIGKDGEDYLETGVFNTKTRYLEIWNTGVFMEYYQTPDTKYIPLENKCTDSGFGLERFSITLNGKSNMYETEVFEPVMNWIKDNSKNFNEVSQKIVCEHTRSCLFLLNEDVLPSNKKQGYILKQLLRRTLRHLIKLGLVDDIKEVVELTFKNMNDIDLHPVWKYELEFFVNEFENESKKFSKLIINGEKYFNEIIGQNGMVVDGEIVPQECFKMFDTFGFPIELTCELGREKGLKVDTEKFNELFEKHKSISRGESAKSGLTEINDNTKKLHTVTHLLNQTLKNVLSKDIKQKGSNITSERLRFDFNYNEKISDEQITQIENEVNLQISKNLQIRCEELSVDEAIKSGAECEFKDKYGDNKVTVYSIGSYSKEICRGPHVSNTSEIGQVKITSIEKTGSGIQRIKAEIV
ncbi:MAG: alanine--tRNA ligase-related protein [Firmicutes bacterium]|nr:alanine--tRNA ligase-related protein [Bacillota bacterium]